MFHHPHFLWLLALVPYLAWRYLRRNSRAAVSFSSAIAGLDLRPTLRQRLAWLPPVLNLCAITLMIVALARPRDGRDQTIIDSEGIAIEMVVDRSSSMQAMDFLIDETRVDRLTAIKKVASQFVLGDENESVGGLSGRVGDLVGMILFAGFADAVTPPTLDHRFVIEQLQTARIAQMRSREDGTAIGDAISLAVEKLTSLDQGSDEQIKSKVIILLTDGENTAGEIDPIAAADLAKTLGIKVYTIGVGTRGEAPYPVRDAFGRMRVQMVEVNIDEQTLKQIADETGAKYFRATDTTSLQSIYAEIDELEKTKVESRQFTDFRELAVQSFYAGGVWIPPLCAIAMLLLAARVILQQTVFRTFGES